MTPKTRQYLVVIAGVAGVVAFAIYANHWYQVNIAWPRDIQTHLFGREVVSHDELIHRDESVTLFAQGVFRWDYRIRPDNERILTLCGTESLQRCHLTKSMRLLTHVNLDAELQNGFLILDEWWD